MTYENKFLPEVGYEEKDNTYSIEIKGDSKCPCCGYLTIPNKGDALAYICPVCMWEIDLFIKSDDESSDLNKGLSLKEANRIGMNTNLMGRKEFIIKFEAE